jgi:hypothetical protein
VKILSVDKGQYEKKVTGRSAGGEELELDGRQFQSPPTSTIINFVEEVLTSSEHEGDGCGGRARENVKPGVVGSKVVSGITRSGDLGPDSGDVGSASICDVHEFSVFDFHCPTSAGCIHRRGWFRCQ